MTVCVSRAITRFAHYRFPNPEKSITLNKYWQGFVKIPEDLRETERKLINRMKAVLLYDSVCSHVPQTTARKFNQLKCEVPPHSTYFPDLSPTDSHFSKRLKYPLQQRNFVTKKRVWLQKPSKTLLTVTQSKIWKKRYYSGYKREIIFNFTFFKKFWFHSFRLIFCS